MNKRLSKREEQEEAMRREIARQQRAFRLKPWEFACLPLFTKGKRNPYPTTHEHHSLWARMSQAQRKIDERRAKRAAAKQPKSERSK
jgi:hypothetical protein